jgi:hypothetical protein
MLLVSLRRAVSVALLAASLTTLSAACGRQQPATGVPPSDSAGGGPLASPSDSASASASASTAFRLIHLATTTRGVPDVHTVLDSEADLTRFPGYFAVSAPEIARAITAKAAETDFSRSVLVGWSRNTGCSAATGASLLLDAKQRLYLGVQQPRPLPECFAADHIVTVFEVPRTLLPDNPRFAAEPDEEADPPGPGRTVAFTKVDRVPDGASQNGDGTEVTRASDLEAFLARLSHSGAATVRKQLAAHPARRGERRIAAVVSGCRPTGAALLISPGGSTVSTIPTGDEGIRCLRAEHYAAVIAVAGSLLPG